MYFLVCCCVLVKLNSLNAELNPIRHLLALVGILHIVHVSRIRVNSGRVSYSTVGSQRDIFEGKRCRFDK